MNILEQEFYGRNTLKVAKDLLGKYLIHEVNGHIIGGKIVETEAYCGITDKGAHVYGGKKTLRTMPLYGQEGTIYLYSIYGMYLCLNAITEKEGEPQGVLIRAIEPLIGLDFMAIKRNGKDYKQLLNKEVLNLTSGPSKLCMALDITKSLNNTLFWGGEMYIAEKDENLEALFEINEIVCGKITKSKRVGIDYAQEARDYLYRFYYEDNPYVSKKDKVKLLDK
ncbi:DNA-3-methyladenine glycosylase [Clostridium vincentii]|uniref:Putative 3-methyladenine DNA glycosylase n=1 Tax=Clostridium vincentii TaxID=52704 RepID=A0A2T0BFE5_9CLOT|nr:DNA-3-methyladenine glycosylase [Clostridium vincentii]PRR82547.1 3-methyladenine DNA glycosylase [Clostridium vincentii]